MPFGTDPPGLGSIGPRAADPRFSLGILEDELKMVSVRLEQLSSPISLAHDPEATKLPDRYLRIKVSWFCAVQLTCN